MATKKWTLDPTHSELQFKVKHLMISNVTGQFNSIAGEITTESEDFNQAQIVFTADISSINTGNEQRDAHLKSTDFFDADSFPVLKFESERYFASDGQITGLLSIRGISKTVTLNVEFAGTNKDPWGNLKAGFSIEGKINRTDFGLTWNSALETGGLLVGEEVKILAEVQFVLQA